MTRLRWGLLGTATINRHIIPAIRACDRSVLHAVGSRSATVARSYAEAWEIPHAFHSYDDLLASDVDVIYNSLPNSLHAEWTIRAAAAGKHVLCEKPLALTPGDVEAMAAAAEAHRRVVTEAFMYRHHAQTLRVQALVADGAIGEVRTIAGAFSFMRDRPSDPRLDPALGGGALWDIGCYPVTYAQMLAGAPATRVTGVQQTGPTGVDEDFTGIVEYGNGVTGQAFASFRAGLQTFIRVIGSTGVLEIDHPFKPDTTERICLRRPTGVEWIDVEGRPLYVDEILDIERAVLDGAPPRISLAESRDTIATLSALYESARSGHPVRLGSTAKP